MHLVCCCQISRRSDFNLSARGCALLIFWGTGGEVDVFWAEAQADGAGWEAAEVGEAIEEAEKPGEGQGLGGG